MDVKRYYSDRLLATKVNMGHGTDNFLGLEGQHAEYGNSAFAVMPVPYDATTTFLPGTRNGPYAILRASQQVELHDDELGDAGYEAGVCTLAPFPVNACGPEAMITDLYHRARRVIQDDKFLLSFGGEHSITGALVKAAREKYEALSVLQLDAHADLRESYEGTPYSHACVMRRIHELGIPICGVGIRSYSAGEAQFMERVGIRPVPASACRRGNHWIQAVLDRLTSHVYVTVDIDGFDPAYAPGTGTPEPGGLDWYQVTALLRAVAEQKRIVAGDIVEVIPLPGQAVTEFLAARLAYKIITYVQACEAT